MILLLQNVTISALQPIHTRRCVQNKLRSMNRKIRSCLSYHKFWAAWDYGFCVKVDLAYTIHLIPDGVQGFVCVTK